MEVFRRKQFLMSLPALLKVTEMVVLVTGMVTFLISNKCGNNTSYVTLYVLPCGVCVAVTVVSYVTALLVLAGGRNPLTTPTWVKGDVWFNVGALVLMLVGSGVTLTNEGCSDTSLTVTAIALGFVSAVLFACSGALTYLTLVRHQEHIKKAQRDNLQSRRVTLNAIL